MKRKAPAQAGVSHWHDRRLGTRNDRHGRTRRSAVRAVTLTGALDIRIRRTIYFQDDQPITLAFVACIADQHPEAIDAAPPPPKPLAIEHPPRLTEKLIRRTLGKDRDAKHTARLRNQLGYAATVRRIEREGA